MHVARSENTDGCPTCQSRLVQDTSIDDPGDKNIVISTTGDVTHAIDRVGASPRKSWNVSILSGRTSAGILRRTLVQQLCDQHSFMGWNRRGRCGWSLSLVLGLLTTSFSNVLVEDFDDQL